MQKFSANVFLWTHSLWLLQTRAGLKELLSAGGGLHIHTLPFGRVESISPGIKRVSAPLTPASCGVLITKPN